MNPTIRRSEQEPKKMRKVKVRCSYTIEIEVREDLDPIFYAQENGCPGTGAMGAELERIMDEADKENVCWACGPAQGECKVLAVDGVLVNPMMNGDVEAQARAWSAVWKALEEAGIYRFVDFSDMTGRGRAIGFIKHMASRLSKE